MEPLTLEDISDVDVEKEENGPEEGELIEDELDGDNDDLICRTYIGGAPNLNNFNSYCTETDYIRGPAYAPEITVERIVKPHPVVIYNDLGRTTLFADEEKWCIGSTYSRNEGRRRERMKRKKRHYREERCVSRKKTKSSKSRPRYKRRSSSRSSTSSNSSCSCSSCSSCSSNCSSRSVSPVRKNKGKENKSSASERLHKSKKKRDDDVSIIKEKSTEKNMKSPSYFNPTKGSDYNSPPKRKEVITRKGHNSNSSSKTSKSSSKSPKKKDQNRNSKSRKRSESSDGAEVIDLTLGEQKAKPPPGSLGEMLLKKTKKGKLIVNRALNKPAEKKSDKVVEVCNTKNTLADGLDNLNNSCQVLKDIVNLDQEEEELQLRLAALQSSFNGLNDTWQKECELDKLQQVCKENSSGNIEEEDVTLLSDKINVAINEEITSFEDSILKQIFNRDAAEELAGNCNEGNKTGKADDEESQRIRQADRIMRFIENFRASEGNDLVVLSDSNQDPIDMEICDSSPEDELNEEDNDTAVEDLLKEVGEDITLDDDGKLINTSQRNKTPSTQENSQMNFPVEWAYMIPPPPPPDQPDNDIINIDSWCYDQNMYLQSMKTSYSQNEKEITPQQYDYAHGQTAHWNAFYANKDLGYYDHGHADNQNLPGQEGNSSYFNCSFEEDLTGINNLNVSGNSDIAKHDIDERVFYYGNLQEPLKDEEAHQYQAFMSAMMEKQDSQSQLQSPEISERSLVQVDVLNGMQGSSVQHDSNSSSRDLKRNLVKVNVFRNINSASLKGKKKKKIGIGKRRRPRKKKIKFTEEMEMMKAQAHMNNADVLRDQINTPESEIALSSHGGDDDDDEDVLRAQLLIDLGRRKAKKLPEVNETLSKSGSRENTPPFSANAVKDMAHFDSHENTPLQSLNSSANSSPNVRQGRRHIVLRKKAAKEQGQTIRREGNCSQKNTHNLSDIGGYGLDPKHSHYDFTVPQDSNSRKEVGKFKFPKIKPVIIDLNDTDSSDDDEALKFADANQAGSSKISSTVSENNNCSSSGKGNGNVLNTSLNAFFKSIHATSAAVTTAEKKYSKSTKAPASTLEKTNSTPNAVRHLSHTKQKEYQWLKEQLREKENLQRKRILQQKKLLQAKKIKLAESTKNNSTEGSPVRDITCDEKFVQSHKEREVSIEKDGMIEIKLSNLEAVTKMAENVKKDLSTCDKPSSTSERKDDDDDEETLRMMVLQTLQRKTNKNTDKMDEESVPSSSEIVINQNTESLKEDSALLSQSCEVINGQKPLDVNSKVCEISCDDKSMDEIVSNVQLSSENIVEESKSVAVDAAVINEVKSILKSTDIKESEEHINYNQDPEKIVKISKPETVETAKINQKIEANRLQVPTSKIEKDENSKLKEDEERSTDKVNLSSKSSDGKNAISQESIIKSLETKSIDGKNAISQESIIKSLETKSIDGKNAISQESIIKSPGNLEKPSSSSKETLKSEITEASLKPKVPNSQGVPQKENNINNDSKLVFSEKEEPLSEASNNLPELPKKTDVALKNDEANEKRLAMLEHINKEYLKRREESDDDALQLRQLVHQASEEQNQRQLLKENIDKQRKELSQMEVQFEEQSAALMLKMDKIRGLNNKIADDRQILKKIQERGEMLRKKVMGSNSTLPKAMATSNKKSVAEKLSLLNHQADNISIKNRATLAKCKAKEKQIKKKVGENGESLIKQKKLKENKRSNVECKPQNVSKVNALNSSQDALQSSSQISNTKSSCGLNDEVSKHNTFDKTSEGCLTQRGEKIDEMNELCPYDLLGRCNDDLCIFQHLRTANVSSTICSDPSDNKLTKQKLKLNGNEKEFQDGNPSLHSKEIDMHKISRMCSEFCASDKLSEENARLKMLSNQDISEKMECNSTSLHLENRADLDSSNNSIPSDLGGVDKFSVGINVKCQSITKEITSERTDRKINAISLTVVTEEKNSEKDMRDDSNKGSCSTNMGIISRTGVTIDSDCDLTKSIEKYSEEERDKNTVHGKELEAKVVNVKKKSPVKSKRLVNISERKLQTSDKSIVLGGIEDDRNMLHNNSVKKCIENSVKKCIEGLEDKDETFIEEQKPKLVGENKVQMESSELKSVCFEDSDVENKINLHQISSRDLIESNMPIVLIKKLDISKHDKNVASDNLDIHTQKLNVSKILNKSNWTCDENSDIIKDNSGERLTRCAKRSRNDGCARTDFVIDKREKDKDSVKTHFVVDKVDTSRDSDQSGGEVVSEETDVICDSGSLLNPVKTCGKGMNLSDSCDENEDMPNNGSCDKIDSSGIQSSPSSLNRSRNAAERRQPTSRCRRTPATPRVSCRRGRSRTSLSTCSSSGIEENDLDTSEGKKDEKRSNVRGVSVRRQSKRCSPRGRRAGR